MRQLHVLQLICWIVLFLYALPALGAMVHLINGDQLTGKIVSMQNEVLVLKTTSAEKVQLKWPEVAFIVSEEELAFVLKSKKVFMGRAICPLNGMIQIMTERPEQSAVLSLHDLEAINPPPAVTFKGSITAGGTLTDGNTETKAANASAKCEARSERHRFTIRLKYNYGETESE